MLPCAFSATVPAPAGDDLAPTCGTCPARGMSARCRAADSSPWWFVTPAEVAVADTDALVQQPCTADLAASAPDPAVDAASTTTSVLSGEAAGRFGSSRGTGQDWNDLGGRRHLPQSTSPGAAGTSPDQEVPAAVRRCGCPAGPGRVVANELAHDAWHALVVEQGGPDGAVSAVSLRGARGFKTETLQAETLLDQRARASGKRANGKLRRAARGES